MGVTSARLRPSRVAALLLIAVLAGIAAWLAFGRSSSSGPASGSLVADPARIAQGGALYATNCASCHGAKGEGQANWKSSNPDGTYPPPPHDASGHTWHHADGLLFRIVRDGGTMFESAGFKSGMSAWGDRLTDEEIRAVITYLKTLWGERERTLQAEVSAADPFP